MLKRLRTLWQLSKLPAEITHEELKRVIGEPLGDGKAEFLGDDMTQDEYVEYIRSEEGGWNNFKKQFGL